MDLIYFETPTGNFGDDLNLWLWDALLPGWRGWTAPGHLIGVGTILNAELMPEGPKLVLGSGAGYGRQIDLTQDGPWDVRAVRGPRTAASLNLSPDHAIADPAVMLPRLSEFEDVQRGENTIFVPHYRSLLGQDWDTVCGSAGLTFVNPTDEARSVVRRIAQAGRVLTESMHGAIVADAFGVPWAPVAIGPQFHSDKWSDWSEALGTPIPPIASLHPLLRRVQLWRNGPHGGGGRLLALLAPLSVRRLRQLSGGPFYLTDRDKLIQAQDRFARMLDGVMRDYGKDAIPELGVGSG